MGDEVILVTGGCGYVGSGIVLSFLDKGWKVITLSRSRERIERLFRAVPEEQKNCLAVKQTGFTDLQSAVNLREEIIAEYGEINHVVACFIASKENNITGELITDVSFEQAEAAMVDTLRPHFLLQKAFLPYLNQRDGTTYVIISGTDCEIPFPPVLGTYPLCSSAISGMSIALRSLFNDGNVALSDLRLGMLIQWKIGDPFHLPFEVPTLESEKVGDLVFMVVNKRFRDILRFTSHDEYQEVVQIVQNYK